MRKALSKVARHKKKIAISVAVVLSVSVLALGTAGAALASRYTDRFLPNTRIAGVDVSRMNRVEAAQRVNAAFDAFVGNGFVFVAGGKRVTLDRGSFGVTDPDKTNDVVHLNTDATLDRAYAHGHAGPWIARVLATGASLVRPSAIPLSITINRTAGTAALRSRLAAMETTVVEPKLEWKEAGGGELSVSVVAGRPGRLYDVDAAMDRLERDFRDLKSEPIELKSRTSAPTVSEAEARSLGAAAADHVRRVALTLTWKDKAWTVPAATRASWIAVKKREGKPVLAIDPAAFEPFLATIAPTIEVTPKDARFEIQNDRVVTFEPGREGIAIDRDALAKRLEDDWIGTDGTSIELVTKTAPPRTSTEDANSLGIKEVLGVGVSSFKGSPPNRLKNIRNSVRKLNGILIRPDEEFSLLTALEPFTEAGGYFKELVIKGDVIEPDTGGGACQIGTTTFRATMNSGLPVLERQNHSLVVRYYGDPKNGNPGTDATIFEPHPDFRFKNDTGHAILFLASMDEKAQQLTFTYWGTNDGRKGSYTAPTVSKWYAAPGDSREVLSTAIAPGKRLCEPPFRGADASFTYTVEKEDGTKEDRIFTSHYRPLPATCLIGVTAEELKAAPQTVFTIPPGGIATGTPPVTNTNQPVTQ